MGPVSQSRDLLNCSKKLCNRMPINTTLNGSNVTVQRQTLLEY